MLVTKNLVNALRLIRSENVGIKTFTTLVSLYGSPEEALTAAPELSLRGGRGKPIKICTLQEADREIDNCTKIGAEILSYEDKDYPRLLLQIEDYPPVITILGNKKLLNQPKIAVVGSRNASTNACNFAYKIANDLGEEKIIVSSGLARGIDTYAHKGSLNSGTIAVLAGGIDNIYPPENKDLYKNIAEKGVIIAELPFGSIPRGQNFPQRNRIISGVAFGVVVVEASFGSGSLITARMALEQNREVFAVPGFPLDPRCQGTNHLLKQGAVVTESAKDVLDVIKNFPKNLEFNFEEKKPTNFATSNSFNKQELDEARKVIIKQLSPSPTAIDEIIKVNGLPVPIVLTVILELELAGKLERHNGNRVSLLF
jgi:DNA processing protein